MPEVSSEWNLYKVGQFFKTGSGTTTKASEEAYFGGKHPWVNTGDLRDGPVSEPNRFVTEQAFQDYSALRIYKPGSLVVAMYGATIGRLGILETAACTNQACCVLFESSAVDTKYAFYWFLGHKTEITQLATGGGQPNISQELIRSLRIPAPSLDMQHELVAEIGHESKASAQRRTFLEKRLRLLAERRQTLITATVTGQIDIMTALEAKM